MSLITELEAKVKYARQQLRENPFAPDSFTDYWSGKLTAFEESLALAREQKASDDAFIRALTPDFDKDRYKEATLLLRNIFPECFAKE